MTDEQFEPIIKRLEAFSQDVSYKFGDYIMSFPPVLRTVALAVVQSCITAGIRTMPDSDRELFNAFISKTAIVTIPYELDPRRFNKEGQG